MTQRYGTVHGLNLFGTHFYMLVGPEAAGPFFRAGDDVLNQSQVYSFTKYVFGDDILYDSPVPEYNNQLKVLSGALSKERLQQYVDWMVLEARDFFNSWADEGVVDLRAELSHLIILTASRCLLGREVREELHAEVAKYYAELDGGMTPLSFFAPTLPTPAHRKRDEARKEMAKIFSKVIAARRASKSSTVEVDFLQTLIDAKRKDGESYTDDQITGLLIVALFAGQHTSAITSTWAGIFMHFQNEDLLAEVLEEQRKVLNEYGNKLSWESLSEMKLLHNCIKEGLRLHAPLILVFRKVLKDLKVDKYTIPAGSVVGVSPPVHHRFEPVWGEDPEIYDPHRYDTDDMPTFGFAGFGGGRHSCMGEQFAYMQVKAIWSTMLQQFEMELVDQSKLPKVDYSAMVVGPIAPMMRFKRRKEPIYGRTVPYWTADAKKKTAKAAPKSSDKGKTAVNHGAKRFSRAEVAKHNKRDDCWLIINRKVYDVTKYVDEHKGGDSILRNAGADSSRGFFGPQHPPAAETIVQDYYIGELEE